MSEAPGKTGGGARARVCRRPAGREENLIIWVDRRAKVVSFHPITGYERREVLRRDFFTRGLPALTGRGYRFR